MARAGVRGGGGSVRGTGSGRALIVAQDLVVRSPGGGVVLDGVSLSVGRERVGIVGVNGVGKTTLALALAGEVRAERGNVRREGRVAYLPQRVEESLGGNTVAGVLARVRGGVKGSADDEGLDGSELAALARMGVGWVEPGTAMSRLSGGERMRVVLAAMLAAEPEVLILDEPTNHLDLEARIALYALVGSWRGGMVAISHDRRLLGLMDVIVELTPRGAKRYGGNYAAYEEQRRLEAAAAARDVEHAAAELRRAKRDARAASERQARRDAQGRANRGKGGVPKIVLNAMRDGAQKTGSRVRGVHASRVEAAAEGLRGAKDRAERERKLEFGVAAADIAAGKTVVAVEDLWYAHEEEGEGEEGGRELFWGLNLRIAGPRRVAIAGPNGSGKSTLLRLIAGELRPARGSVRLGVDRVALLDQQAGVLDTAVSVLENYLRLNPGSAEGGEDGARVALARFMFRGDNALRPVGELSGGERLRAALACVLGGAGGARGGAPLLMLDEPGNHLDLECLGELEGALRGYAGAIIVVSHDEAFLEAVGVDQVVNLGKGPR